MNASSSKQAVLQIARSGITVERAKTENLESNTEHEKIHDHHTIEYILTQRLRA